MSDNDAPERVPWVCFSCRKVFRKPAEAKGPFPCSDCRRSLQCPGLVFPTPRREATRQWAALQKVFEAGIRFVHDDVVPPLKSLADATKYIEDQNHSRLLTEAEKLLSSNARRVRRASV